MRIAVPAAAAIILLALTGCVPGGGAPTPSETPTAEPAPVDLAPCADGTITPTVRDAQGAAGHLNFQIVFTNSGPECTLEGYPQVAVLGHGNGTQLGVVADDMPDLPVDAVAIDTGASAYAWLQAVDIAAGGGPLGEDCRVEEGDGFNIWVPGAIEPTFVASPGIPACTSGIPWMSIAPISAT